MAGDRHLDQVEIAELTRVDHHVGAVADVVQRDHVAGQMVVDRAKCAPVAGDLEPVPAELLRHAIARTIKVARLEQGVPRQRNRGRMTRFAMHGENSSTS